MQSKTTLTEADTSGAANLSRRRLRLVMVTGGVSALMFVTLGFLAGFAAKAHGVGFRSRELALALAVICVVAVVSAIATLWFARNLATADGPRSPVARADELQRNRAVGLCLFAFFVFLSTGATWKFAGRLVAGEARAYDVVFLGSILLVALCHLGGVLGVGVPRQMRAVFDDEFSRHLRGRAVMIGFIVLFCAVAATFAVGIHAPAIALQALPLVLLYTVVIVSVSYATMDLRAARGD